MGVKKFITLGLLSLLFQYGYSINEYLNKNIPVAAPRAACVRYPEGSACPLTHAAAKLEPGWIPPDWQCPCPVNGGDGGHIIGSSGTVVEPNDDAGFFTDYVVAEGFINPVGVSFADDGITMFVGTRDGVIWHVNLETGVKTMFYDISDEVGFSGDRGLMDVRAHPDYANVRQMLILYTTDDNPGDGQEPHAESAMNQRLIRVQDANLDGIRDPEPEGIKTYLFGGKGTVPYDDSIPVCFNTHAVGSIQFGWDGSLFVSAGEGAHWNFDMGDWGQNTDQATIPTFDPDCRTNFGPEQDVGAWRAQITDSLAGKILRLAPDTGAGICSLGVGAGYPIKNPFWEVGSEGLSRQSKIWAFGARNPFRLTVRPPLPGEANGGPGVAYFGDVGQGGYEEVNAVLQGGLNFGWPCWEGPMPSPMYRDSMYNMDPNHQFSIGCKGDGGIDGPCEPIETIAYDVNGIRWTCPHMYYNYTVTLPFFYYSRFFNNDNAGYFAEIGYTGQGFQGASIGGLTFYKGTSYPTKYHGQLFALDFSDKWIKVLYGTSDIYERSEDFMELIYTAPLDGAKVTLESHPNGDICYVTMNGGEVRCFAYVVSNVPPTVTCSAEETTFETANYEVKFNLDGTFDRENDQIKIRWEFGDGTSQANKANPTHTYTGNGPYRAVAFVMDQYGNEGNCTVTVRGGNRRPTASIISPTPNILTPDKVYFVTNPTEMLTFDADVTDDGPIGSLSYEWEITIVHNNHIHNRVAVFPTKSFQITAGTIPNEGNIERNNVLIYFKVTDAQGASATDYIRVSPYQWEILFGTNNAPVPNFDTDDSFHPLQVGQPVRFDGTPTVDSNGDRIDFQWTWGDGTKKGIGAYNSHIYDTAGTYPVTLMTVDNWGASDQIVKNVVIGPATAVRPVITPQSGKRFSTQTVTLATVSSGATMKYTTNGNNPITNGLTYNGPFTVPFVPFTNVTVRAVTIVNGLEPSEVSEVTFQYFPPPCTTLAIKTGCSLSCVNDQNPQGEPLEEWIPASSLGPGTVPKPDKILRYLIDGITATYDESKNATRLKLRIDATSAGSIVQARASYDFTNDGVWDRVELFNIMAPNDVADWEEYQTPNAWLFPDRYHPPIGSVVGTYENLVNGVFQLELWQAGGANVRAKVLTGSAIEDIMSTIELPYDPDSSSKVGPESCLDCPGGIQADVCGECGGPGPVGCDLKCFSTLQTDVCGVCGGPGETGCDSQCFSNKTVDSCGDCGGLSDACTIPAGTLPANELTFRGDPCNDMVPEVGNGINVYRSLTLPDPHPATNPVDNGIPTNPAHVVKASILGLTGYYNIDRRETRLDFFVDSGNVGGQQIGVAIEYDFNGDNTIDRTEIFQAFPPNDLPGWEKMTRYARTTGVPPGQGLQSFTGSGYQDLVNGNVHMTAWIANQGANHGPVEIRADGGVPYYEAGATVSIVFIPYITTSWENFQTGGECGAVSVTRNATFTTQAQTTAVQTTQVFTTERVTTALYTTEESTTGVYTTVDQETTMEQQTTATVDTTAELTTEQMVTTEWADDEESTTGLDNTIASGERVVVSFMITLVALFCML